jgi:hypothetical protein
MRSQNMNITPSRLKKDECSYKAFDTSTRISMALAYKDYFYKTNQCGMYDEGKWSICFACNTKLEKKLSSNPYPISLLSEIWWWIREERVRMHPRDMEARGWCHHKEVSKFIAVDCFLQRKGEAMEEGEGNGNLESRTSKPVTSKGAGSRVRKAYYERPRGSDRLMLGVSIGDRIRNRSVGL